MTRDYPPNTCSISGCLHPRAKAWQGLRDLCSTHYKRAKLYGSPTVAWLRTKELTPYRILVKTYRPTTARGYIVHPPQDVLDALAEWLNPEGPIPSFTDTPGGARNTKEGAYFKRMLHWWWSPESQNGPTAKTRGRFALGTREKILKRVYWHLVAVACAVEEQPARFSKGRSDHYAYVRAVLTMRKGWTNHLGAARRLLAVRWSQLAPSLAVPVQEHARAILTRKREADRHHVEEEQVAAKAREEARRGHRRLVKLVIQPVREYTGGWQRPAGEPTVSYFDPEIQSFVSDPTEKEMRAARVEHRREVVSRPKEHDTPSANLALIRRFDSGRW